MTAFTASDVLLKAASIVEQGWCQGTSIDSQGRHCALGAIAAATAELGGAALFLPTVAVLVLHVGGSAVAWNDTPGRTADEVANAMRKAAGA